MGIETEYGITCVTDDGSRKLSADEIARFMFRPVVEKWSSSNIFIPNASRLYLDVGSHPEIATAECDSIAQLVAYDRAGDIIVDRLARQAEQQLAADGISGDVYLFKNNLDSAGNSYGCHENYLVAREVVLRALGKQLLPFLITRQLICGAGTIKDGAYHLSQRADHVWEGVSSATTRSRPIINTRDEPHADSHRFRRLHVIVGDSNLAEPTTAVKIGATLLVLEMIEAGFDLPSFELANEIAAIKDISADLSGATEVPLVKPQSDRNSSAHPASGAAAHPTALEIQQEYCDAAHRWLEVRDSYTESETAVTGTSTAEFTRVVELWRRTLEAIRTGDYSLISRDIDWAIKLTLMRQFQEKLGIDPDDFSHPKLQYIDLKYHDIRAGRGLFPQLETRGVVNRWITDDAINDAVDNPPATTRAALRGKFLAAADVVGAPFSVDWMRLKVNRPDPQIVELNNPFQAEDCRVDDLIDYMRLHQETYVQQEG
ncbi:MAG: Pup--protein ligase [Corynebacterium sp.]|uniref:Pup--protein ligase n=1 Tax=Corynebacterium sp. TaxID=1720 RepID=UPI0026DBA885|nr:Pup--protein ligase [Corynebacterium sp.]MDO5098210.1 Pup--protein ligase [Corynebacterium sp.]